MPRASPFRAPIDAFDVQRDMWGYEGSNAWVEERLFPLHFTAPTLIPLPSTLIRCTWETTSMMLMSASWSACLRSMEKWTAWSGSRVRAETSGLPSSPADVACHARVIPCRRWSILGSCLFVVLSCHRLLTRLP